MLSGLLTINTGLSDVVGGAFLGDVVGKNIVHFHYRRNVDGVLQPYITQDAVGLQMVCRVLNCICAPLG